MTIFMLKLRQLKESSLPADTTNSGRSRDVLIGIMRSYRCLSRYVVPTNRDATVHTVCNGTNPNIKNKSHSPEVLINLTESRFL
jgi:hypothetical protein